MLYEYLKRTYKDGEPIFTEDIKIEGLSRVNLNQQLKTLTDNGLLIRYEKGIYYIPRKTYFRNISGPSSETVAKYKYISRLGKTNGFYSGNTFANMIGISLQVPMKKEIVSNNIAAVIREIPIGKQIFIVRKSCIPVNSDNVRVLQFLELLKNLDRYTDDELSVVREKIAVFVCASHITRREVDLYIRNYPDSIFRNYYEMRLDHVLA